MLRHNNIRNLVAKTARDVGFKTDIEHGGGLGDQRRPGDVIVYDWCEGRHLLIDVAIINPLCSTNVDSLISTGVGGAATAYGRTKERTYRDLDQTKYDFIPFIVETTGGFNEAAIGFCKEIRKRFESSSCCNDSEHPWNYETNSLQSAISVELQRANSRMVLERTPVVGDLIETAMVKCELAVAKKKENAIETLQLERLRPRRIHRERKTGWNSKDIRWPPMRTSTRVSVQGGGNNDWRRCPKKEKQNLSQGGGIWPKGHGKCCKKNGQEPSALKPKPPEEDKHKKLSTVRKLTKEEDNEERILALKSNNSQNMSTSEVTGEGLLDSLGSNKNLREGPVEKDRSACCVPPRLMVSRSQVSTESNDKKKVRWRPPFRPAKPLG